MKRTFDVYAVCSSTWGGNIANINTKVEFDPDLDPVEDFVKKARNGIFLSGYNILHWGSINGIKEACCLFVVKDKERLARIILRNCADYAWSAEGLDAIKDAENGKVAEGVFQYNGEWRIRGGFNKSGLEQRMTSARCEVRTINTVLEELGFDPNDEEGVRRVCHNLGFDR